MDGNGVYKPATAIVAIIVMIYKPSIDVATINHSEIGVMFTNLANRNQLDIPLNPQFPMVS